MLCSKNPEKSAGIILSWPNNIIWFFELKEFFKDKKFHICVGAFSIIFEVLFMVVRKCHIFIGS